MKRNFLIPLALFALFLLLAFPALAGSHTKGDCDGKYKMKAAHSQNMWSYDLDDRLFDESGLYLSMRDELKLSPEQVEEIKAIKRTLKKELIINKAEIKAIKVDIRAELIHENLNADTLQGLYDQKQQRKKIYTQALVKHYVELRSILNDEQRTTFEKHLDSGGKICPYSGIS